jgi:hypothetical protein
MNHMIFHQLIGDPEFYKQAPAFYFMMEQGLAVHQKTVGAIVKQETGCTGCSNIRAMVAPLFRTFAYHVLGLAQDNPDALRPVAAYIADKKGYVPKEVVLYYRHEGITHKVVF